MKALSEIIRKYREENGVTLDELAQKCGLSKPYISMLEKDKNPKSGKSITPSYETMIKLADAMNVPRGDILIFMDDEIHGSKTHQTPRNTLNSDDLGTILEKVYKKLEYNELCYFKGQKLDNLSLTILKKEIKHLIDVAEFLKLESSKKKQ